MGRPSKKNIFKRKEQVGDSRLDILIKRYIKPGTLGSISKEWQTIAIDYYGYVYDAPPAKVRKLYDFSRKHGLIPFQQKNAENKDVWNDCYAESCLNKDDIQDDHKSCDSRCNEMNENSIKDETMFADDVRGYHENSTGAHCIDRDTGRISDTGDVPSDEGIVKCDKMGDVNNGANVVVDNGDDKPNNENYVSRWRQKHMLS